MAPKHAADRIGYNKPFRENVQGRLMARFRLDADGKPIYEIHPDDRRLRVYTIELFLDTPQAQHIDGVDYFMDDPSFIDPEGSSKDRDNQFLEEITSYGDVEVVVTVHMGERAYEQRAWLSNMLENGHEDDMTLATKSALERIRVN